MGRRAESGEHGRRTSALSSVARCVPTFFSVSPKKRKVRIILLRWRSRNSFRPGPWKRFRKASRASTSGGARSPRAKTTFQVSGCFTTGLPMVARKISSSSGE